MGLRDLWQFRAHALKVLPLTAAEYWGMTLAELADALAGAVYREEREWERSAWLAAHIINISGKTVKKSVKADQLLGRSTARRNPRADFSELVRRQRLIESRRRAGLTD